jgi:hypothetical protein
MPSETLELDFMESSCINTDPRRRIMVDGSGLIAYVFVIMIAVNVAIRQRVADAPVPVEEIA